MSGIPGSPEWEQFYEFDSVRALDVGLQLSKQCLAAYISRLFAWSTLTFDLRSLFGFYVDTNCDKTFLNAST